MDGTKAIAIAIGAIIIVVIAWNAIVPEKDCAGNNTWDKEKVCATTK